MRIAFWDLETTALDADFGQLLCGVIGEYRTEAPCEPNLLVYELEDFKSPAGRCNDRDLAVRIRDRLEEYDLVIGYNSVRFDRPFLDTRLTAYKERGVRIQRHKDLLYTMRGKFRLGSNSLKNVGKFLFGDTIKTEMSKTCWRQAHAGLRASYDEVIYHCQQDVIELARVWDEIKSVAGVLK